MPLQGTFGEQSQNTVSSLVLPHNLDISKVLYAGQNYDAEQTRPRPLFSSTSYKVATDHLLATLLQKKSTTDEELLLNLVLNFFEVQYDSSGVKAAIIVYSLDFPRICFSGVMSGIFR